MVVETLESMLAAQTRPGELYERLPDGKVRCYACGHRCLISDGRAGICQVRFNRAGTLYVPHGYVGALQSDPVEKKPFFHVLPGARALSFGMLGCDYHCGFCQNWLTSQVLRDPAATAPPQAVTAEHLIEMAERTSADVVASTYNEPLITSEWAVEVFRLARARGLTTAYVSNGNGTREALDYLKPWVDCYKVDLKSFQERNYRALGGQLKVVLETIERLHAMGFWVEIVTLVIPSFNDADEELTGIAKFLASISRDLPWHVTAFHQDYKMTDPENTTAAMLLRAVHIGEAAGLRYVYAGNLPGQVGKYESTFCPSCRTVLIERRGFQIVQDVLTASAGVCPTCQTAIPGRWGLPR